MGQVPLEKSSCICDCKESDEDECYLISEPGDAGEKVSRISNRASYR